MTFLDFELTDDERSLIFGALHEKEDELYESYRYPTIRNKQWHITIYRGALDPYCIMSGWLVSMTPLDDDGNLEREPTVQDFDRTEEDDSFEDESDDEN